MYAIHQLHVLPKDSRILFTETFVEQLAVQVVDPRRIFIGGLGIGGEQHQVLVVQVIDALEILTAVDGPGHRMQLDIQLLFNFFHQIETVLSVPVHLIDKNDHRCSPHPAYLHQTPRLGFHPIDAVDNENDAVHGRQCPVGVLGKILVTGGIQQIDKNIVVFESHHRCRHRYTSLALYLHEIAGSMFLDFIALDRPSRLNGAPEQQEFLGERCLTGIGVGYDGKSLALSDLAGVLVWHKCPQRYDKPEIAPSASLTPPDQSQSFSHRGPDRRHIIGQSQKDDAGNIDHKDKDRSGEKPDQSLAMSEKQVTAGKCASTEQ